MTSLFLDEFVTCVAADHRFAVNPTSAAEIEEEPHVAFGHQGIDDIPRGIVDRPVGPSETRIFAIVQNFGALPLLSVLTRTATVVPRRLAELMMQFLPLHMIAADASPSLVDMCLAWSPLHETDLAHRWFRQLVAEQLYDARFR